VQDGERSFGGAGQSQGMCECCGASIGKICGMQDVLDRLSISI
jgi:hypothetical protein